MSREIPFCLKILLDGKMAILIKMKLELIYGFFLPVERFLYFLVELSWWED
jgi:hypothetical protein